LYKICGAFVWKVGPCGGLRTPDSDSDSDEVGFAKAKIFGVGVGVRNFFQSYTSKNVTYFSYYIVADLYFYMLSNQQKYTTFSVIDEFQGKKAPETYSH
jgi:hypothetical protein